MTYPNNNEPLQERGMRGGAMAAIIVFCVIIAGLVMYAFSGHDSNTASRGMTTTSTIGRGTASTNNIGGQQGTHAGEGGGAAPSNR
jgi:hypothetical protein